MQSNIVFVFVPFTEMTPCRADFYIYIYIIFIPPSPPQVKIGEERAQLDQFLSQQHMTAHVIQAGDLTEEQQQQVLACS